MFSKRAGSVRLALACLAMLVLAAPAWAQLTRGIISGTVSDNSGGVLPGVTVTITNQDTGVVRTTVSNDSGVYRVPALEPGAYTAQISGAGAATGVALLELYDVP